MVSGCITLVVVCLGLFGYSEALTGHISLSSRTVYWIGYTHSGLFGWKRSSVTRSRVEYFYVCAVGWRDNGLGNCIVPICPTTCANGGVCVNPDTCSCKTHYLQPYCESMCSHKCQNGGICIAPETCQCKPGYFGPVCSTDCGPNKADIMFVLDSSSSLGQNNYNVMKSFVKSLITNQVIGNTNVRIGILTYSDFPEIRVHLNESVNKPSLLQLVDKVPYLPGITDTKNALYLLEQEGFKHARPSSPHIAILITDGHSYNISETSAAAEAVRAKGIQLFTISVGTEIDNKEIDAIASDPNAQHEFSVNTFAELDSIVEQVTISICKVHTSGTITEAPQPSTPVPALIKTSATLKECKGVQNDVLFLLDSSNGLSRDKFEKVKVHVEEVVARLNIGTNQTQVAVVTFSNYPSIRISLGQFNEKRKLIEAIRVLEHYTGETETDTALEFAKEEGFKNHRKDTPDVVVIITEGLSAKPYLTQYAADSLKASGKTVIVTGIGPRRTSESKEDNYIASEPNALHAFYVDDFTGLKGIKTMIAQTICTACTPKNADVVIMLDSSGSIGEANFKIMKDYVKQVIDVLHIGANKTNIGIISYSDVAQTEFLIGTYNTRYFLNIAVDNITFLSGATNTGAALEFMRHNGFVNDRPEYPNIAVLITDGVSKDKLASVQQARLAKQAGITIVVIGVGFSIDLQELKDIASTDITKNQSLVYIVDNFDGLQNLGYVISNVACGAALDSNLNNFTTPIPSYQPAITNCTDTIDNCDKYGADVCSDYHGWSSSHCPRHCGFCRGANSTTPRPGHCVDKINNCKSYGSYVCKDLSFFTWVKENCPEFCGLCGSGTIPTDPPTTTAAPPNVSICADQFDNCHEYGGMSMCTNVATEIWAKEHCPEYCGFCNIYSMVSGSSITAQNHTCPNWRLPIQCSLVSYDESCCSEPVCPVGYMSTVKRPDNTSIEDTQLAPTCADTIANCDQYGGEQMCSDPTYTAWAHKHCPKYCGICHEYKIIKGIPVGATNKTCPDWQLLKDCFMSSYVNGCCPLPSCPTDYVLTVKPPLEID